MAEQRGGIHPYTDEQNAEIAKIALVKDNPKRNARLKAYAEEQKLVYERIYQKMLYAKGGTAKQRKRQDEKAKVTEGNPVKGNKKKSKHKPYQRQNHVPHKSGTPLMVSQTEIRFNI